MHRVSIVSHKGGAPAPARLTPTQRKVMEGVHSGLLNKQIAFALGIAEATVKAHMTALMRKLNVRNRTQVAIAAQSINWPEQDMPSAVASTEASAGFSSVRLYRESARSGEI